MTCMKQDLIDNCKTDVERFCEEMDDEFPESDLYDWLRKDDVKAVSCSNFYKIYKMWCLSNGEKGWSNKAVGNELKNKKLYATLGENRNGDVKRKHYIFPPIALVN